MLSRKQKIKWMAATKLNTTKYIFHEMCDSAGGTAHARAKLNAQLMAVTSETNRYEQTMMALERERILDFYTTVHHMFSSFAANLCNDITLPRKAVIFTIIA